MRVDTVCEVHELCLFWYIIDLMNASLHSWDLSPAEAAQVQANLRERLVLVWDRRPVTTIGGVDISIKTDPSTELGADSARAAIVVLQYPNLKPLEAVTADAPLVFPYIPGFLAFREGDRKSTRLNSSHSQISYAVFCLKKKKKKKNNIILL